VVEIGENTIDAPTVHVWLANGEKSSGLGLMTQQYLEQTLADDEERRRRATRLRGSLALDATDSKTAITIDFRGGEIWIRDGVAESVDAYVGAPFPLLLDLLGGRASPVSAAMRRRVRVRTSLRRPLFALQVLRVLKAAPPVEERPGALRELAGRDWARGVLLGVVVGFLVTLGVRALSRREMSHG
jgi:putative sterol carrier protein